MELSEQERLILSNQYRILENLYPGEAETFAEHRKIVEDGYTLNYEEISTHIFDELSKEECKEVIDVLDMHHALHQSTQALEDQQDITIQFPGFDGNNETKQMAYTRFYIENLHRFTEVTEISESSDFNSHRSTLPMYRRMLTEWEQCEDKNNLTRADIDRILNARTAPQ